MLGQDVNWYDMILGLVPPSPRLLHSPPPTRSAPSYSATIFTVSYFFHSSLCFLLIFASHSIPPLPFFNLICHVSYPFLVSLHYLEGIRGFKIERYVAHAPKAEADTYTYFARLGCRRNGEVCGCATMAEANETNRLIKAHKNKKQEKG